MGGPGIRCRNRPISESMNPSNAYIPAALVPLLIAVPMTVLLCAPVPAHAQEQVRPSVAEPTEAEIETAYAARIADINDRSRKSLGAADAAPMELTLEGLKKLECRVLERVGTHYDCRVEARTRQAQRRPRTDVVDLWLSYEDDGWVAR